MTGDGVPARLGPVIGIAGGIGSGKSMVADMLSDLGCVVSYSDLDARMELNVPEVRAKLVDWWGQEILDEHGEVDRSKVAGIVFEDETQRRRLEAMIHPRIEIERRIRWAREARRREVPAFVIDAPLLFEVGLDAECDAVIFVESDRITRLSRVSAARGWTAAELDRREKSQWPLDTKRERSDYVISNAADVGVLKHRVAEVLDQVLLDYQRHGNDPHLGS